MMPGISKALITTAVGMLIAIPAMMAYRYFQRVIVEYVVEMEQQATIFHAAWFYDAHFKIVENDEPAYDDSALIEAQVADEV